VSTSARTALRWILRLAGVAILAWVLATQVQWEDRIVLRADGDAAPVVHSGQILYDGDEGYRIRLEWVSDSEAPIAIDRAAVAERSYGDKTVPDVTYGARTLLRRLADNIPLVVLVLLGLSLLVVLTGWRWYLLMRGVGLMLPLLRSIRLTFIGGFFNMAVPGSTGGDVVKAWYAAKETRTGTRAVISVFADRFVGLFGLVVFAAAALLLGEGGDAYRVPRLVVFGILGAALVGGIVLVSRPVRRALGLSWIVKRLPFQGIIDEIQVSARLYRGHTGALLAALGISLFNHAGNATACWLLARALGIEGISLGTAMALVPLANLLSAVPLLPGGWGVGELAFAYFFGLVGVPPTEAVGLSVVFRLAVLGVNLPGGVLWIFWRGHPSTATIAAEVQEATAHVADHVVATGDGPVVNDPSGSTDDR
jgi:uncharacterized membrane protein YbhN (UPF0104 family)